MRILLFGKDGDRIWQREQNISGEPRIISQGFGPGNAESMMRVWSISLGEALLQ